MAMATPALSVLTAAQIIERLGAALRPREKPILAFDADGTLWEGDVGDNLFEALLSRRAVRAEAAPALREEALRHGVTLANDPSEQAALLFAAHRMGKLPDEAAFAMMAWAFAGFRADEMYAFAERVVSASGLEGRLHAELGPVLRWAREAGVETFIVSASPRAVVEQAARRLSIPPGRVVAMTPRIAGGRLVAAIEPPLVYGAGKARAIEAAAPGAAVIGAFGDNGFDVEMLRLGRVAVAVRPKPALLEAHARVPGLVAIAREPSGAGAA